MTSSDLHLAAPVLLTRLASLEPEAARPPRAGDPCPQCGGGILAYDGLLNLACSKCGLAFGGGGGCT